MKCDRPICTHTLGFLAAGWVLIALFVGETELLSVLPPLAMPMVVFCLSVFILVTFFLFRPFQLWVQALPLKALVSLHLVRFVGIYFIVLSTQGKLDSRFAVSAGCGDIVVACGAATLLALPAPRWAWLAWNAFGLIDILGVVSLAALLRSHHPECLNALTQLPLSFLPTLIVPWIIATHIILFTRLKARRNPGAPADVVQSALTAS